MQITEFWTKKSQRGSTGFSFSLFWIGFLFAEVICQLATILGRSANHPKKLRNDKSFQEKKNAIRDAILWIIANDS
jgi:predicted house-cleaning noncanonical NTP pyrophosphatase (MazG superfamily)